MVAGQWLWRKPTDSYLPPPPPIRAAKEGGFGYSIVRPGQIKGDPFLAYSNSGAALSPDAPEKGSAKRMVSLQQGDSEAGDVNPSTVAEAFTQVKTEERVLVVV